MVKSQISEKKTVMEEKLSGTTGLPQISCSATCLNQVRVGELLIAGGLRQTIRNKRSGEIVKNNQPQMRTRCKVETGYHSW